MKKQIFLSAVVIFTTGTILTTGCKKDDTTPPVITLTGGAVTQNIGDTYVDPGYSATDDKDGNVTANVKVTGVVNGLVGIYTIKYDVSDAAGNAAIEQTRSETIKSDQLAGNYTDSSFVTGKNTGHYGYTSTVTQSTVAYNQISISNLGGLGTGVFVTATISGQVLTIASQSPSAMQDPGTISGTGTVVGKNITSLNYTINYTSSGSDNCNDTWYTHQ